MCVCDVWCVCECGVCVCVCGVCVLCVLLKTLNEPGPTIRDSSAEALGTAMKLVGEKQIMGFLTDVDIIVMTKIKECCNKAVIVAKDPKTDRPCTAPAKS